MPIEPNGGRRDGELVSLNLVTTYPVHWSAFAVLRDFLQNFFDAVPGREFNTRVRIEAGGGTVMIRGEGVSFSHEWLVPIGASTKTLDTSGTYAGQFGEGFKIAALCATRDLEWRVACGARDWCLDVTTVPLAIDGARLHSLAYRLRPAPSRSLDAWLRLDGVSPQDVSTLMSAVRWSFYYPENPLLERCLWQNERAALWTRSSVPVPPSYPKCREGHAGILFVARQARGTHELPFAFASHDAASKDRDRANYFDFQVVDDLSRVARNLPPQPSAAVLQAADRRWADRRQRRYQVGSWEPMVAQLAANVAKDVQEADRWRARHPNLLVLNPVPRGSIRARNRRAEARAWMRTNGAWRVVQPGFGVLGYPTLEQACEDAGGFLVLRTPTALESRRIELLVGLVTGYLADLFPFESSPAIEVVDAPQSGWGGYAVCHRRPGGARSSRGRRVRYQLSCIALRCDALAEPTPHHALSTLVHELCHAFGADESSAFSSALTDVLERLLTLSAPITELERAWLHAPKQEERVGGALLTKRGSVKAPPHRASDRRT